MLCSEIMSRIEERYPLTYACSWDNVGLLAGRADKEVKKIYLALDATDEVIGHAIEAGADMLITHHPMIFGGMKRVNDQDFLGRKVIRIIQGDLAYYAMHTNFDVLGMADLAGGLLDLQDMEVLEVTAAGEKEEGIREEGIGRVGNLPEEMSLRDASEYVKRCLKLDNVKVFGDLDGKIRRAALCPGSGKSEIGESLRKGADVLIAGDIDHHSGLDAVEQGLAVIDAGHYGTEYIFMDEMERFLNRELPDISVEKEPVNHPFAVI